MRPLHSMISGLLKSSWSKLPSMQLGAYREQVDIAGRPTAIFVTYHTSATGVNCGVSKYYDSRLTEQAIHEKSKRLPVRASVDAFLAEHSVGHPKDAEAGGMRVLLTHWLDIGYSVRADYESA